LCHLLNIAIERVTTNNLICDKQPEQSSRDLSSKTPSSEEAEPESDEEDTTYVDADDDNADTAPVPVKPLSHKRDRIPSKRMQEYMEALLEEDDLTVLVSYKC